MTPENLEHAGAVTGKAAIGVGALTAAYGFMADNIFGLIGALVAVMTLAVTWYYKREDARRKEAAAGLYATSVALYNEERALRIQLLRKGYCIDPAPDSRPVPIDGARDADDE